MGKINSNYFIIIATIFALLFQACKKSPSLKPEPIVENNILHTIFQVPLIINQPGIIAKTDLDKDGVDDLKFGLSVLTENLSTDHFYYVEPLNANVQVVATNLLDAYSFPANSDILDIPVPGDFKRWTDSKLILLEKLVYSNKTERVGMFNGSNKSYLGVRIRKDQQFHYSWIEIKHNESSGEDQIIISAAGFHKLSGLAIKAGAV